MLFRFVYRTADIPALVRSLDSLERYISCSVHNCEWQSMYEAINGHCVQKEAYTHYTSSFMKRWRERRVVSIPTRNIQKVCAVCPWMNVWRSLILEQHFKITSPEPRGIIDSYY